MSQIFGIFSLILKQAFNSTIILTAYGLNLKSGAVILKGMDPFGLVLKNISWLGE